MPQTTATSCVSSIGILLKARARRASNEAVERGQREGERDGHASKMAPVIRQKNRIGGAGGVALDAVDAPRA
jgi:hypothetical protein